MEVVLGRLSHGSCWQLDLFVDCRYFFWVAPCGGNSIVPYLSIFDSLPACCEMW